MSKYTKIAPAWAQKLPREALETVRDNLDAEDAKTVRQLSERWNIPMFEVCRWLIGHGISRLAQLRAEEASERSVTEYAMALGTEDTKPPPEDNMGDDWEILRPKGPRPEPSAEPAPNAAPTASPLDPRASVAMLTLLMRPRPEQHFGIISEIRRRPLQGNISLGDLQRASEMMELPQNRVIAMCLILGTIEAALVRHGVDILAEDVSANEHFRVGYERLIGPLRLPRGWDEDE